jgi:hypothetical protein
VIKALGTGIAVALMVAAPLRAAVSVSILPKSFADRMSESQIVAVVEIEAATPEYAEDRVCGTRYAAKIVAGVKYAAQDRAATAIAFGRDAGLTRGHRYLLFFTYSQSADQVYERFSTLPRGVIALRPFPSGLSKEQALAYIRCNGLVPGYSFTPWEGLYEVDGSSVFMGEPMPSPWPPSVRRDQVAPGTWSVDLEELLSYMRSLTGAP